MRLFKNTNIQFVKSRYVAYAVSLIILVVGLVGLATQGLNWSIDFTSGVAAKVNLKAVDASVPPLKIDQLRSVLGKNGYPEAEIQYVGDPSESTFMIKIKSRTDNTAVSTETKNVILKVISEQLPEYVKGKDVNSEVIEEIYEVGPKVGGEMRTQAMLSVLIALLLIIVYIWFRFELTFGVMAVLALFHDVLCIVGIFAITGKEITVQIIAALLTIVGYSINDTIVIFDRIREDLKVYRKDPYDVVFNRAMNSTLSRTVITAGTTLFTALALYFFGGTVLHDFAFAMTLGVIFGTYSSIFVASNMVIDWYRITNKQKQSIQHLTKKK